MERVWYWAYPKKNYVEILKVTEHGYGKTSYEVIKKVKDYAEALKIARSM